MINLFYWDNGDVTNEMREWSIEDFEPIPSPLDMYSGDSWNVKFPLHIEKHKIGRLSTISMIKESDQVSEISLKRDFPRGLRSLNTLWTKNEQIIRAESGKFSFTSSKEKPSDNFETIKHLKKISRMPKQLPLDQGLVKIEDDNEWEREEFNRKKRVMKYWEQLNEKENKMKLNSKKNTSKSSRFQPNFSRVTTDFQGKILFRSNINAEILPWKLHVKVI